ncbi:MAG: prepilin peptidase [Legionella sp.]
MYNLFFVEYPYLVYITVGLFAAAIGSLLNVFIYRLPLMIYREWRTECRSFLKLPEEKEFVINLFFPRSFCPHCKNMVPIWHNIPLLSYCLLKGRCSHCQATISWLYPLVEFFTIVLSLLALYHFGISMKLAFALLFVWLSIVICFIDLQHQLIPDSLSISLLWMGLLANTQELFSPLATVIFAAIVGYLMLWLLIKIYYLCTGKIGMGNGDFKLFAAYSAWFGWQQMPFILLCSSLLGAIIGIIYLKSTRKSHATPLPFGPFLCFSGLVSLFYGPVITKWYITYCY